MISKELFSEVMNIKIEDIVDLKMFGKELKYYEKCLLNFCGDGRLSKHKDSICKSINIYELTHKCKEWAIKYIANIGSGYDKDKEIYWCICNNGEFQFYADTELEAIFKACQWILDNEKES